jgi:hypothetical protein
MEQVIAFILGWLASFSASVVYALGVRPNIDIHIEDDQQQLTATFPTGIKYRVIHLLVENKRADFLWRWYTERQTAWGCEVVLEVLFANDNTKRALPDKIIARWSSTSEPTVTLFGGGSINGQPIPRAVYDKSKLPYGRRFDLHGNMQEKIDLIIKNSGEQECYILSNESYQFPYLNNPKWKLDKGNYLVTVQAQSGRIKKQKTFKISNDGIKLEDVIIEVYNP